MSWSIVLSPGGDITSLVDVASISRTERLYTELAPNVNKLELRVKFSSSLFATLLANDVVEIAVQKDAAAFFTGVLSPNYKTSIRDGQKFFDILAEDYTLSRLGKTVAAPWAKAGYAICTPSATSTSLVHAIATEAGVTLASSLPTISSVVPYVVALPDDKVSWGKLLEGILYEYGHVYYFEPDGKMNLYRSVNTGAISTTGTLTTASGSANIRGELGITKSPEKYDDIRIKYNLLDYKTGIVLFQDTTGATDAQACTIPLAAAGDPDGKDYYPLTSKVGEVFSAWGNPDGFQIWVATSAAMDATIPSGVTLSRALTNYYRKCSFAYRNTSASVKNITKLRITGNAYVISSKNTARSSIASAKNLYEYEAKYIFNDTDAATLAKGIAQYFKYSDIKYNAKAKTVFSMGQYVLVADAIYAGISTKCRVVGITTRASTSVIEYDLEGVADFVAITVDTEGESVPNTISPPGSVPPPDNNVTDVVMTETQNADGTVRVEIEWEYTQGSNVADAAFIYWNTAISSAPPAFDYARDTAASKAMTADGTYSWTGNFPGRTGGSGGAPWRYRFGVVAVRGVQIHASGAVTPTGWDDKTLVPIIQDMPIRSSDGQGVNKRAIQISNSSLDWLDTPDTSPASPELLTARIGRLGVGGTVLMDGEFTTVINADNSVWTSEWDFGSVTPVGRPCYIVRTSGEMRIAYPKSSALVERIWTGSAWGSELTINAASSADPTYLEYLDGTLHVAYRRNSDGFLVERIWTGSAWGSEIVINNASSYYPSYLQMDNGQVRVGYINAGVTRLVERLWDGSAWGSESNINTSNSASPNYIKLINGEIRIAYKKMSPGYIYERIWTGSAWGSELTINAASSADPTYLEYLDGTLHVAYRRNSDGFLVERIWTGSAWGSEIVINNADSNFPTYKQLPSGNLRIAYKRFSDGYLVERTLQRYAQLGAGIIESGSNSNGSYIKFSDGTMVCWHVLNFSTTGSGTFLGISGSFYKNLEWTYPAEFAETPYVLASGGQSVAGDTTTGNVLITAQRRLSASTTSSLVTAREIRVTATTNGIYGQVVAIGRWLA